MKISPWILGAAVLVPVAGAAIGHNMSTEPIGVHQDVSALLPDRPHSVAVNPVRNVHERLPDHYALETPEGRIEVSELAWHGRFRDRVRRSYADYYYDQYDVDAELARMEARWDIDASTSHAAAALDAQQPRVVSFAEAPRHPQAPHFASMERARTGEVSMPQQAHAAPTPQTAPAPGQMRVVSVASQPAVTPRHINVGTELALRQ